MKKLVQYSLLLVLIGALGYFVYYNSLSPCDKPLEYSVGQFDAQFGITKDQFKNYTTESEAVWEKALGRNVFISGQNANFKINLIYDERQIITTQKQKTEFGLSAVEKIFQKLDADFSIFKSQYDREVSSYESALTSFKDRKSAYDTEVAFWNSRGGAPREKYTSLETERRYLNSEAARLNDRASSVNAMTKQLNALLAERNAKAEEYNRMAEGYNKKYNGGLEFNQAEYTGKEINVYQFSNKKDLILALTHELGHALGMGHVENPKSIMYYITGVNADVSLAPSAEDLVELKKVCKL